MSEFWNVGDDDMGGQEQAGPMGKARVGLPGKEPDMESIRYHVIGRDGKVYRYVPLLSASDEEKDDFVAWQRAGRPRY